jgi:type II secretory pathway component PulF
VSEENGSSCDANGSQFMSDVYQSDASPQTTLGRFHRELKAAVLARVPLELSVSRIAFGKRATLGRLKSLELLIDERLGQGQTLTQIFSRESSDLPIRYREAFRVFDRIGDARLVLDGLANRVHLRRNLARVLRSTLAYLLAIFLLAAVLLSFFSDYVVPTIDLMRADLLLTTAIDAPKRFDATGLLPQIVTLLNLVVYVLFVLLLFGFSSKIVSWLGGRRYQTHGATAMALRTISALMASGMSAEEAAPIGCNLVGGDRAVRKQVGAAIEGRTLNANTAGQLDTVADHYQASATNRLAILKVALPVTMVAVIGGATTMGYSLAVFWPVVSLLKDLSIPVR